MIEIPDTIQKDLDDIDNVAKDLKMKLYVVGGFPRDIIAGTGITDETDLDVTEANGNAFDLAFFVSARYNLMEPEIYKATGTALVTMNSGRPVEFHNAFFDVPHIIDQLYAIGVEPTPINKDVYSRDFTINTLLFDPDNGKILDVTGRGVNDIKNKILKTPLSPEKTLAINPKIILRGIRFAIQFNLEMDEEYQSQVVSFVPYLVQFIQDNPNSKMVERTVKKTMSIDPKRAMEEYRKIGILQHLPRYPEIEKVLKEDIFGVTISPTSSVQKIAQSQMMKHLLTEREKHKAYMRRKKRERTEKMRDKFDILDKARTGYYLHNSEPEFLKKKKMDKRKKLFDYIVERN